MFARRDLEMPEAGQNAWPITLPATTEELEEAVDR
jgi:hypothetical protein